MRWELRRNCAMTPAQMGAVYLSMCALSAAIAIPFALQGAAVVLAFAGLELLVVGAALLVYVRRIGDGDTLTLSGRSLRIAQVQGSQLRQTEFRAEWVCVEPSQAQGSLVELSGQGQRVQVGRLLHPALRPALAQELRLALRTALSQAPFATPAAPSA